MEEFSESQVRTLLDKLWLAYAKDSQREGEPYPSTESFVRYVFDTTEIPSPRVAGRLREIVDDWAQYS